jgi:hypothetical protein
MGRWNPDAIERQLARMEENDVRRAYMHAAEFWNERVEMMQVWADYLDQLRHRSSADQSARRSPALSVEARDFLLETRIYARPARERLPSISDRSDCTSTRRRWRSSSY